MSVFFIKSVLNADISVFQLINLKAAAAKIEIRIVFIG